MTYIKDINAQSNYKTFSIAEKNPAKEKDLEKINMFT